MLVADATALACTVILDAMRRFGEGLESTITMLAMDGDRRGRP